MDATTPSNLSNASSRESASHRRLTMLLTVALVVYWLVAFLGTHLPVQIPAGVMQRGGDKLLHFVGYSILASLLMGLRASRGPFGWYSVVMRWLVLAAYGAFDEVTQHLVGRHADVADWYADLMGACCGLGFVVLLVRVCSLRTVKRESQPAADKAA
ncbi:MAG: VanZ family protein [Candidatus Saccharimonas sp.]|nr:VanZ family protein [Planctomycetaceae bacterium]